MGLWACTEIRTRAATAEFTRVVGRAPNADDFVVWHVGRTNLWTRCYYFADHQRRQLYRGERNDTPRSHYFCRDRAEQHFFPTKE